MNNVNYWKELTSGLCCLQRLIQLYTSNEAYIKGVGPIFMPFRLGWGTTCATGPGSISPLSREVHKCVNNFTAFKITIYIFYGNPVLLLGQPRCLALQVFVIIIRETGLQKYVGVVVV
jgi:hypothetical protein